MEILSTQVRTKRMGDKKSNFLRQMKGSDANCNDVNKLSIQTQVRTFSRLKNRKLMAEMLLRLLFLRILEFALLYIDGRGK